MATIPSFTTLGITPTLIALGVGDGVLHIMADGAIVLGVMDGVPTTLIGQDTIMVITMVQATLGTTAIVFTQAMFLPERAQTRTTHAERFLLTDALQLLLEMDLLEQERFLVQTDLVEVELQRAQPQLLTLEVLALKELLLPAVPKEPLQQTPEAFRIPERIVQELIRMLQNAHQALPVL